MSPQFPKSYPAASRSLVGAIGLEPTCPARQHATGCDSHRERATGRDSNAPRVPRKVPWAALVIAGALALVGCGAAPPPTVAHLHAILKAGPDGVWYVQGDAKHPDPDHAPICIVNVDKAQDDSLTINFDRNYPFAGVIQVTPDDDFGPLGVTAYSNLGKSSATLKLYVNGVRIKPRDIGKFVPNGSGNFFVSVAMVNKPKP